ncbi:MAG TPA: Ig-like domain-containing protein [Methanomicrobiales archaeon]|nr:Ig-like domain-containing protein [Methanomicrobiales archaeon]
MRLYIATLLIILICTFTAVAEVRAAPDHMTITGKDWMVANGLDSSTITVTVLDSGGNPVPVATVVFRLSGPWTLSMTTGVTDSFGRITTVLQPTTKSGAAVITVNASDTEAGVYTAIEQTYVQNIDHGTPQYAVPIYDLNASVGSTTPIQVNVTDAFGNPVDNRNVIETVQFTASGSTGSGFWDGTTFVKTLTVPVDANGAVQVSFLVAKSGTNFIDIQPPSPVLHKLISINGVNDGPPYSIMEAVSPGGSPYPYTKTDGSKFWIEYSVFDQFGNPSASRGIHVTTNVPGEDSILTTNANGIVAFYYQKDVAGLYTITAAMVDNASVTCTQTVEFIAANPTDMLLTASPQTMPSRDVKSDITATIFAKVIDAKGNPVSDQNVAFDIKSYSYGTFTQTLPPSIEDEDGFFVTNDTGVTINTTTDADGYAQVIFRPGAFTTNRSDLKYSANAQGSAIVQAVWGSVTHTIELQYKNYPFLSVDASVDPKTLTVNQSVNITIKLKGDGWALQPKPIDVVLVWDRSGSMLYNQTVDTSKNPDVITSESPDDRMVMAMNAGKLFADQMNSSDRIGSVSFGDLSGTNGWAILFDTGSPYLYGYHWRAGNDYKLSHGAATQDSSDDVSYVTAHYPGHGANGKYYGSAMATTDLNLTLDKTQVKNIIMQMVPNGGTPMRDGLYQAVKMLVNNPRAGTVRAIVMLTDGAWNTDGDPRGIDNTYTIAPYTELQNDPNIHNSRGSVITWAADNNISIYTIALGTEPYLDQLQAYANQTGGKSYYAPTGTALNGIYQDIAGALHTQAGVDTTMDLAFQNVEVNSALIPGLEALKYVCTLPGGTGNCNAAGPRDFVSTHEFSYNLTMPVIIDKSYDQTADWAADQDLHFNVGTIFVGGVWQVNFSMKVLKDGNIKILDSNSSIMFNDGTKLPLPDTYITARPENTGTGPVGIGIWVTDLHRTDAGTSPDYVDIAWNTTYTGIEPTFQEDVDLLQEGTTDWIHRSSKVVPYDTTRDATTLDISSLPSGTWDVRVTATALDTGSDAKVISFIVQKAEKTPKIRIS